MISCICKIGFITLKTNAHFTRRYKYLTNNLATFYESSLKNIPINCSEILKEKATQYSTHFIQHIRINKSCEYITENIF